VAAPAAFAVDREEVFLKRLRAAARPDEPHSS
jgi:hypothetical protein